MNFETGMKKGFEVREIFLTLGVVALMCGCAQNSVHKSASGADEALMEEGKLVYDTHCLRCHGADGKSDTYPRIVTLDGIGERMSLDEILEATWATGLVDPSSISDEEQHAMAVYIASL